MKTLVAIGNRTYADRQFAHGEEIQPDLMPKEVVDYWIDHRWLHEYRADERRSLYRLFSVFSECAETERLTEAEVRAYAMPR